MHRTQGRIAQAGGWAAFGAALAVATDSSPIGIGIVAAIGGALAWWRTAAPRDQR